MEGEDKSPNFRLLLIFFYLVIKMALERDFQSNLIKEIKERVPGCIVMKNDPNYIQGIPDLLILYKKKWAALECKKSKNAKHRPNQDYYISEMDKMSYAAFVYPENKEEVLDAVQHALRPTRSARISGSK